MLGGKVDISSGTFGRCAMLGTRAPCRLVEVHLPPDAHIFSGFDPACVLELVWLVQIQYQVRGYQVARFIGNLDGSPWRYHRCAGFDSIAIAPREKVRFQRVAADQLKAHAAIINQCRFVETQVQAVGRDHRDGRMHRVEGSQWSVFVKKLVTIPLVGIDRPRTVVAREAEFGELVHDHKIFESILLRNFIPKSDAVVE